MSEEPPLNKAELKIVRNAKRTMMILARILGDKDLPDLPRLNPAEETAVMCALGPAIFDRISDAESDDNS